MAKIERVIKSEIVRLAKREMRKAFLPLKRDVRQMSGKLSGLSKALSSLMRLTKEAGLEKQRPKLEATPEEVKTSRITPARIQGLRKKLGISQREMGVLLGASTGAVVSWERGKFRPQGDKKAALVGLRKLGKRQVKAMLQEKGASAKPKQDEDEPVLRERRARKAQTKVSVNGRKSVTKRGKPTATRMRMAA